MDMAGSDLRQTATRMAKECLSARMRRVERTITRHYDAHVSTSGVSAVQLPLLTSIYLNPLQSLREQAGILQIDRTTLWRNLRPLINRGLVMENRQTRPARFELSSQGMDALEAAIAAWTEAHESLQVVLGKTTANNLESALRNAGGALR